MAQPAPLYTGDFTDEERALIAGFILHFRRAFLQAGESAGVEAAQQIKKWSDSTVRYYQDAERVTRFLLYWIGYPVGKDQMWSPFYDAVYPPTGTSWSPPQGS